jgi:hypothetical protein
MESLKIIAENINFIMAELYIFIVILDKATIYIERNFK